MLNVILHHRECPCKLESLVGGWYLVQTDVGYLSGLDGRAIVKLALGEGNSIGG